MKRIRKPAPPTRKAPRARRPVIEEIEPRILYSADFSPGLLEVDTPLSEPEQRVLDASGEFVFLSTESATPQPNQGTADVIDTAQPDTWELELLLDDQTAAATPGEQPLSPDAEVTVASTPLAFERNDGQVDAQVDFFARGSGYAVWLTDADAVIALDGEEGGHVLRLDVLGGNPDAIASGADLLAGNSNYLIGPSEQWHTDVANYAAVYYDEVYDGIDLRYYGNQRQLEYDFILDAGAQVGDIRLALDGAADVSIAQTGELVLDLGDGQSVVFKAPVAWQEGAGGRESVASRYLLFDDGSIGFEVGAYDQARELVIDPVFSYGTYLGGTSTDQVLGMAVDAAGYVYVTGFTLSSNYPVTAGAYRMTPIGGEDVFVTKLTPDLSGVVYSTYLGGSNDDAGYNIAVDAAGNAYVTGYTLSANFPRVTPYQNTLGGTQDAFLTKLNAAGNGLVFSTYLGSSNADTGYWVVVDGGGSAYVAGYATANDFPTTAGAADTTFAGGEGFVTKFTPAGTGLVYSTFIGGNNLDAAYSIAVDAAGNVAVVGETSSTNFPVTAGAYQASRSNGQAEVFVAMLNAAGSTITYATYLGDNGVDQAFAVAFDGSGRIYVTGQTAANNFDVTAGALQTSNGGGSADMFLSVIDPSQSGAASLVYSTYLGGGGIEEVWNVSVDSAGRVYIAGSTNSNDFPTTAGAHSTTLAGSDDVFVVQINPGGAGAADLLYGSYWGGANSDTALTAAYANGKLYFGGATSSTSGITTAGAVDSSYNNLIDGFVAAFTFAERPVVTVNATPLSYVENAGAQILDNNITVSDVDSPTLIGATLRFTANYVLGEDSLAFTNAFGISGVWSAAAGTLTLSGSSSVANYQAALRSVTYTNVSQNPSTLTRSVQITVNDDGNNSVPVVRQINVGSVNDVPAISAPGPQAVDEDGTLTFSSAGSNAIAVNDVDAGSNPVQLTLTATNGTVTLFQITGLSFTIGDGTGDASMTFTGTIANINAALNGLRYNPAADYNGAGSVVINMSDLGNTGSPGPQIANRTVNVTVNPVNDAPTISVIADQLISEDGSSGALIFTIGDAETAPGSLIVTATSGNPALIPDGNLTLGGSGANRAITVTPPADFYGGPVTITLSVSDGTATTLETFDVTIANVADHIVVVTTADDLADGDISSIDALLMDRGADGLISLREAIEAANGSANASGPDRILFDIAGAGPHTINVVSALPVITDAVIIDATTQSGFAGEPLIELNGAGAGVGVHGLHLSAGGSTVRGLVINRFDGSGILVDGGGGNTIAGNTIGLDRAGNADLGNAQYGIWVQSSGNMIGGTGPGDRNVVSGNDIDGIHLDGSSGNVIQGNYVGTDALGTAAVGNTEDGIWLFNATDNVIGGNTAAERNVLSGNNWSGIGTSGGGSGNVIRGNYIGVDATGAAALPNQIDGINILGANGTQIGGIGGAENVIAFNLEDGVSISSGTGHSVLENFIYANGGLGIDINDNGVTLNDAGDVDGGTNLRMNFPVIYSVVVSGGTVTVTGEARPGATVRFYEAALDPSGYGEGQTFIGSGVAGGILPGTVDLTARRFSFSFAAGSMSVGDRMTATATDASGNTSEFALSVAASAISPGIIVTPTSGLVTNEDGGNASFTVMLATAPLFDVTIAVSSSDTTEGTVSTSSLTFTNANWSTAQTVTVTGVFDTLSDGPVAYSAVLGPASSLDLGYLGMDPSDVSLTNNDGVNNAPVNAVPGAQSFNQDTSRIFSAGGGNGLSVSDSDVGAGPLQVTLSATHGVLSLAGAGGLTFTVGDGSGDASMTFQGNQTAINAALDGMNFTPDAGYSGSAVLSITTSDLGGSGTGGPASDADNVAFTILPTGAISGTILRDVDGDADVTEPGTQLYAGATVRLYRDAGNGIPDAGDTPAGTTLTNASGQYSFTGLSNGTYWVSVDSTTLGDLVYNAGYGQDDVWADQTYGVTGAMQGAGFLTTPGALYGGRDAFASDDAASLATAEHITRVFLTGSAVTGVDSGFSFSAIVNTRGDASDLDGGATGRLHQGSLRQFLINANAIDGLQTANFSVGSGAITIASTSALPTITDKVALDATTQEVYAGMPLVELSGAGAGAGANGFTLAAGSDGSTVRGFVINRFNADLIRIDNSDSNVIAGNFLGTDRNGTLDLGAGGSGVHLSNGAGGNQIGGTLPGDGNVISGNDYAGVNVNDPGTDANIIQGNCIGTGVGGAGTLGNTNFGIVIWDGASANQVGGTAGGAGNVIAYGVKGVTVDANAVNAVDNTILGNRIFGNSSLGIDLFPSGVMANDPGDGDAGPNDNQNYPVLTSAQTNGLQVHIIGTLNSTANLPARIEFFATSAPDASGHGEAERYLGYAEVLTNASGDASFDVWLTAGVAVGESVTATATRSNGTYTSFLDTSEFAQNVTVTAVNEAPVNSVPGPQAVDEDLTLAIGGVSVDDANGNLSTVQLGVASGVLNVSLAGGASISAGANDSGTLTLSGTQVQINDALATLAYQGNADFNGADTLTVLATDAGGLTDSDNVAITVNAVNDAPTITSDGGGAAATRNVIENGTFVTDVDGTDIDLPAQTLGYSIAGGADAARFGIDALSGVLTFLVAPNRELPSDADLDSIYEVTVRVSDGNGGVDQQMLTITVLDADEFNVGAVSDTDAATNSVTENAANGTVVGISAFASDADATNSAITYSLDDNAGGRFAINGTTGVVTVANGTLLDREAAANHAITVRAASADGSSSTQVFSIAVADVDEFDVGAISDTNATANSVAENAANGTVVGVTAFASDADATNNAVTYSLDDSAGGRFAIGAGTGVVTVANGGLLDREAAAGHSITVRATSVDGSSSTQVFSIAVSDVDEFDVGAISDTNAAANSVAENAANGTVVGVTAFASDADATTNTITYSLDDSAGGRFAIAGATGMVTVADGTLLDREAAANHAITVRATSADGSSSTQVFSIALTDVDEFNVGAIGDTNAAANSVAENAANGTMVGVTALASDADATNNAITYSLDDDAGGRFAIGAGTGVVTLADGSLLDSEAAASHDITVRATSLDGSFSTQVFNIAVTDVDDFDVGAISDTNAATNSVAENAVNGTVVGVTAFASDADATNNTITYSLDDDAGGRFAIGAGTGVVTVADGTLLDREAAANHAITVRATSADGSSSTQVFSIAVTDVDEFDVGAISDTNAAANSVAENAANGTVVGVAAFASDADATNNAITYSLDNDAGGRFAIGAGTGIVTVSDGSLLDREAAANHAITVRAASADGSSSTQVFSIAVTDVDEFDVGAIADTDAAANSVAENSLAGTPVGITAFASDADATGNAVVYSLDDSAGGLFAVDTGTGVVRVAGALDAEAAGSHSVTVHAASADGSFSTRSFVIAVADVNDVAVGPVTDADPSPDMVSENTAPGTTVGIAATAVDGDVTATGVGYSLDDDAGGRFAIHAVTGVVTTTAALDHEAAASHDIVVRATSADASFSTAPFTIGVGDVNEAPVVNAQTFVVDENSPAGSGVGLVTASDPDAGEVLTWSILAGNTGGAFAIDAASGQITVANSTALDFETVPVFALTVEVLDAGGLSDTTTVTVNLNDLDESVVAADDAAATDEDSVLNVTPSGVLANDIDLDGGALSVSAVEGNAADVGNTITLASGALLRLNADGSFFYDPNGAFDWLAAGDIDFDSFGYESTDSSGGFDFATVTITLTGVNDAPAGVDSTVSAVEDTPFAFNSGDFGFIDADGTLQAVTIVSLPAQGSLTLAGAPVAAGAVVAEAQIAAGDLVFTAAPDQYGAGYASFGFRVSDGLANAAAANTLSIDVAGTSDLPTVAARTVAGSEDVVVAFAAADFASAFTDVDGDTLVQVQIVSLPANGTLTVGGTPVAVNDVVSAAQLSSLQFVPSANWSGSTLFTWHGHDGTGYSVLAADMTLTLAPVNDVPVLSAGAAGGSVSWGGTLILSAADLRADDVDNTPSQVVYTVTGLPIGGTLYRGGTALAVNGTFTQADIDAGQVSYAHGGSVTGADGFAFTVADGMGGSIGATTFDVAIGPPPPPPPVITPPPPPPPPPPSGGGTPPPSGGGSGSTGGTSGPGAGASEPAALPISQELEAELVGTPAPQLNDGGATRTAVEIKAQRVHLAQVLVPHGLAGLSVYEGTLGPLSDIDGDASEQLSVTGSLLSAPAFQRADLGVFESVTSTLGSTDFLGELDTMHDQVDGKIEVQGKLVASSVAVSGGLSVGYVIWLLRGGLLLSSLLSSLPAWHAVDPMPVLARGGSDDDDEGADEDPLERLFGKAKDALLGGLRGRAAEPEPEPEPPAPAPAADAANRPETRNDTVEANA